jgi:hypothetical protein
MRLDTLASLPFHVNEDDVHLVWISPCSPSFRGTSSPSKGVGMNTQNFVTREQDWITSLLILHKQAKFWTTYSCKYVPWAFFVVNNGDNIPNGDLVQKLRCSVSHMLSFLFWLKRKQKQKGKKDHCIQQVFWDKFYETTCWI